MSKTKACSKCKIELPLTNEYFYRCAKSKNGFKSHCIDCQKKSAKKYYENGGKGIQKEYEKKNKERLATWRNDWKENNRDKLRKYTKKWRSNPTTKEKIIEYNKKYKENNSEKVKKYNVIYNKENRDIFKKAVQKRRALKKNLPHDLTVEQWHKIQEVFNYKCAYCGKKTTLVQEHFIPLSKGGEYTINNIIPSCGSCNSSKRDKFFFDWYPTFKHYDKQRKRKILKYLNYDKNNEQQLSIL